MLPTWLFEADVFGETAEPLKAEIRRQGMACYVTRQDLLAHTRTDSFGGRRVPEDGCVVCCGSVPFVRFVQLHRAWIPGGWCNTDNLSCTAYYPPFEAYLLNRRHTILTGVEATCQRDALLAAFGREGRLFVRPDGCQKLFTGRVVDGDNFADALAPARYDPETRVVIAEPRPIAQEWRLVVAEGRMIAASQYLRRGVIEILPGCPSEVYSFADAMLTAVGWLPDELFMLDVCESEGQLFLLEINSFSCSALYQCDLKVVVEVSTRLAVRAWTRKHTAGTFRVEQFPLA